MKSHWRVWDLAWGGTLLSSSILVLLLRRCNSTRPRCDAPVIYDHVLSPEMCRAIIRRAQDLGPRRSTVVQKRPGESRVTSSRTSSHVFLPPNDPIGNMVKAKVAALTGRSVRDMEDVQVVHYLPGQEYKPHYDACLDGCDRGRDMPRTETVYMYLNEPHAGGHTSFPTVGVRVSPKTGRAVHWYNMDKKTRKKLPCSYHGADPVIACEKWGCNVWIR